MGLSIHGIKTGNQCKVIDEDYDDKYNTTWNENYKFQLGSLKENTVYEYENINTTNYVHFSYSGYSRFRAYLYYLVSGKKIDELFENSELVDVLYRKWYDSGRLKKINRILDIDEENELNIPPFFEMLYFSDCEGIIGPNVCKKLLRDFKSNYHLAKKGNEYHKPYYEDMIKLLTDVVDVNGSIIYV